LKSQIPNQRSELDPWEVNTGRSYYEEQVPAPDKKHESMDILLAEKAPPHWIFPATCTDAAPPPAAPPAAGEKFSHPPPGSPDCAEWSSNA
jgi:hypothetical protein